MVHCQAAPKRAHARLRFALAGAVLLAICLTACHPGDRESINQRAVDPGRLVQFASSDELVLRGLKQPITLPSVRFASAQGPVQFPQAFAGHWTLLYTGYTFCPDICPTELTELHALLPRLKAALPAVSWQVIFLSVDPGRDQPARLKTYLNYFDPSFLGITGARDMIDRLTRAVKAGYRIAPHAPGARDYEVEHDTAFRLISPQGRMVAILPSPHDPGPITRALSSFFNEVVQ